MMTDSAPESNENIDPQTAGGPHYEVLIERSKVREFARAMLTRNHDYTDERGIIPPTFLTTSDFLWAPHRSNPIHALGFDISRQLHGEIEYIFYGEPSRIGDCLFAATRVDRTYEKTGRRGGRMRFAVLVTEFRNSVGDLVAEERSTVVEVQATAREAHEGGHSA
jgi:hypothetical protein